MVTVAMNLKLLAPWKESYDKPGQYTKKQRHHLPTKVHIVKTMVFPVVMYRCENWTIKKAEHQRIDAFKLWCWRRCLRVPWTAEDQSILKKINPEYLLEWLILKLKLQYFGHTDAKSRLFGKDPDAGKDWGLEEGWQRIIWLDSKVRGYEFKQTLGDGEGQASLVCSPWGHRVRHD